MRNFLILNLVVRKVTARLLKVKVADAGTFQNTSFCPHIQFVIWFSQNTDYFPYSVNKLHFLMDTVDVLCAEGTEMLYICL